MYVKKHTWESYVFLLMSVSVMLSIVLLDTSRFSDDLAAWLICLIGIGTSISIILAFSTFRRKTEKKVLPSIALTFTIVNTLGIVALLWFGINFA